MEPQKDSVFMRIGILSGIILLIYAGIVYKLQKEQIYSNEEYKKKILQQSIRTLRIPSVRGRIFTSDNKILADNKVSFDIELHLDEMRKPGHRSNTLDYIYEKCLDLEQALGRVCEINKSIKVVDFLNEKNRMSEDKVELVYNKLTKLQKMPKNQVSFLIRESIEKLEEVIKFSAQLKFANTKRKVNELTNQILQLQDEIYILEAKEKIRQYMMFYPGLPQKIFKDMNQTELAVASEFYPPIKGMNIIAEPERSYPQNEMAAHILGRVKRDDPEDAYDIDEFSNLFYIPDLEGVGGIEKAYDLKVPEIQIAGMRGKPGKRTVLVDNKQRIYKNYGLPSPQRNGNELVLTIDGSAQKIAEKLMKEAIDKENKSPVRGAFVLLDADTGAIIAMVSSPTFDVDKMVPRIPTKVWNKLNNDPKLPLLNRALMKYTPGSTMKPLVSLALLRSHINPDETVNCQGGAIVSRRKIKCMKHHGHIDMRDAIKHSCNTYFIEQGVELGMEKITETFRDAGLGSPTGIILPEYKGYVPTYESVLKTYGYRWGDFDTGLLSIGQGKIQVSPLQAATFTAAISNGGALYTPYLLKEVRGSTGITLYENKPRVKSKLKASPRQLAVVKEGMRRVVANFKKHNYKTNVITLSGKTGTAERAPYTEFSDEKKLTEQIRGISKRTGMPEATIRYKLKRDRIVTIGSRPETTEIKQRTKNGETTYTVKRRWNNTWFIGFGSHDPNRHRCQNSFCKHDDKRYAFAMFIEHGEYGSTTCAPLVGQFFEQWFNADK